MTPIIEDFGTGYVAYCPLCYARLGYEVEHVTTCPECGAQVLYMFYQADTSFLGG